MSEAANSSQSTSVQRLSPDQIRVVDIEGSDNGTFTRRDCYDLQDGEGVVRVEGGRVFIRAVQWTRTFDDRDVTVGWEDTGLPADQVEHVQVYTWPKATLVDEIDDLGTNSLPGF